MKSDRAIRLFVLSFLFLTSSGILNAEPKPRVGVPAFLPEGRSTAFLGVVSQPAEEGVVISQVVPDSAAWKLGLQAGDVIEAIDGFRVGIINGATYSLPSEIRRSGDQVSLRIRDVNSGQIFDRIAKVGGPATNKGAPNLLPVLGITSVVSDEGENIYSVAPNSPAERAGVQEGDLVHFVDGYRVGRIEGNVYSLASEIRHASGSCALTLTRNGQRMMLYPQFKSTPISNTRNVHCLLVGLTKDDKIGEGVGKNLINVQALFEDIPQGNRGKMLVVADDQCNAASILEAVRSLQVNPGDTIFCYYAGHGAYDPSQQDPNDPSGGHFFQIPGGDLYRKTLMKELTTHGAKLTVLITDTCNVPSVPVDIAAAPMAAPTDEPPLVTLLLRYRGVVDISGSTRDQFGWYRKAGGLFTDSFVLSIAGGSSTWSGLLDSTSDITSKYFNTLKQAAVDQPQGWDPSTRDAILKQDDQRPQAFQFDVSLE